MGGREKRGIKEGEGERADSERGGEETRGELGKEREGVLGWSVGVEGNA